MKSEGICRLCKKLISGKAMARHLQSCTERNKANEADNGQKDIFLIKASCDPFFVYFEIDASSTLEKMDNFLRDLWLECCGHLSAFKINDISYSSHPSPELEDKTMSVALKKVLKPNQEFFYEYDFGTTTHLGLKCISEKKGIVNEKVFANPKAKSAEDNQQQKDSIIKIIDRLSEAFNFTIEDKRKIRVMIDAYFRKRKGITTSNDNITAAAFLWQYSKINFLWENDKSLMKKKIANTLNVSPNTVGNKASEISKSLKIGFFDERFCRKEVSDKNPFKQFAMTPQGFIIRKEQVNEETASLKKDKEDYFYDGTDFLQVGNKEKAIGCFNKALDIDSEYVDAHNGMGNVYFNGNLEKSKQYYQKAYELTKNHFNNQWPISIEWGIIENRQYLRAMHGLGLILWREGKSEEAKKLFMLMLRLNNGDNQGARYLVAAILEGMTWEEYGELEDKAMETGDYSEEEKLFEKQNKIHNFYRYLGDG